MRHPETRNRIIEITCDIITRQGIRSAHVDDVARIAGISKRTLYEMFKDKNTLILKCLERLSAWRHEMLRRKLESPEGNSLYKTMGFVREYVDALYMLDSEFLAELKNNSAFSENYERDSRFWHEMLVELLHQAVRDGYILPASDVELISETMLTRSYELRMEGRNRESQRFLNTALLRGIATTKGIALFDDMNNYVGLPKSEPT